MDLVGIHCIAMRIIIISDHECSFVIIICPNNFPLCAEGAVTVTIGTANTEGLEREIDTIFGFLSNSDTLVLLEPLLPW